MVGWEEWWQVLVAFAAAFGAGAVNAMAGGGTNLSFPTLLWLGLPAVSANATNAVSLWPGTWGSAWGFRREIRQARRWWYWLLLPALAGGGLGAFLLLHLPSRFFRSIAPWLVLGSTLLVALEPALRKRLQRHQERRSRTARVLAFAGVFVIATYGGYFGAGLGIMLITALGLLLGVEDVRVTTGFKNLLAVAIKGVAVGYFLFTGAVVWRAVLVMAVGALSGGYTGGRLGHRIGERKLRWAIVLIGVIMATVMFLRLIGGA